MTPFEQITVGILVGLPSSVLAYKTFRKSERVDRVTEQTGISAETRAGLNQITEGWNTFVDQLQEDNKIVRESVRFLTARLDEVLLDNDRLKRELADCRKRYGEIQ